jgi:V/A-type H+-transporting ATPase subunit I
MARAVLVGPREKLSSVIETLYDLKLVHILDYRGEDDTFHVGKPLPPATVLSEDLLKLRSIANILAVKAPKKEAEEVRIDQLREKILSLELNITEEDEARKNAQTLLADLDRRIEELRPFAALDLPLETYRGYETIAPLVGRIAREVSEADIEDLPAEVFGASGVIALFTTKTNVERAQAILGKFGFAQLEIPQGEGNPKDLLEVAVADREKWQKRFEEIQGRIGALREKYATFVVAAEEALEIEVDKAEAPLRFAVSDHSFVVDGWVPAARFPVLSNRLAPLGVFVEGEPGEDDHAEAEPPVLLKNPKPVKPFEMLIHLYSTPSYHELDPSLFLLIAFPVFFGFMIGDAGYGSVFLTIGAIALTRLPKESDFRRLLLILALGGLWSLIFGLFVFGEAFGMAFHLPLKAPPEELSWAQFGLNFPIVEPLIHKTLDLGEMFYLSIVFGFLHLGTSYVMGFVNEVGHNRKHAISKLAWFICLFGIFTLLTRTLSWTPSGHWVWSVALSWFPGALEPLGLSAVFGTPIPFASLLLILTAFLGILESPVAPLEIGGLLANVLSYLRLAAIGIGKATIAATFNTLIFHALILEQGIAIAIVGFALLTMAQLLVFLLGGVSAAIQGIRLNYVESFTKFYKGNGTMFQPFGARVSKEV